MGLGYCNFNKTKTTANVLSNGTGNIEFREGGTLHSASAQDVRWSLFSLNGVVQLDIFFAAIAKNLTPSSLTGVDLYFTGLNLDQLYLKDNILSFSAMIHSKQGDIEILNFDNFNSMSDTTTGLEIKFSANCNLQEDGVNVYFYSGINSLEGYPSEPDKKTGGWVGAKPISLILKGC